jgi:diguanylate cyclase (GGDEF)-like protein
MPQLSRARPVGTFAARLAVAVLLAACLGSALVALLADRLAVGAVRRETVVRVTAAADAVAAQLSAPTSTGTGVPEESADAPPDGATDLSRNLTARFATLAAEPDVLGLLVVDQHGRLLVGLAGTTHQRATTQPATTPDTSADVRAGLAEIARGGRTVVMTGPGARLTVSDPIRLPDRAAALRVELDAGPAAARAAQLWRALGVALMLGAAATTGLVFVTGGWALARRHERALLAASSDDLTGLGSRRAFGRDLRVHVNHASRQGLPLTLALIDVNGLEAVNATVGRRRGDALLLGVGSVLQRTTAPDGHLTFAYRIGGDTFALIMPAVGQDDAFALTDTLRRDVSLDAAPLTANVGLSLLDPLRCPDPETLLIAADAALFEARSLGGNRVVGAGDGGTGLRWVATSGHDRLAP